MGILARGVREGAKNDQKWPFLAIFSHFGKLWPKTRRFLTVLPEMPENAIKLARGRGVGGLPHKLAGGSQMGVWTTPQEGVKNPEKGYFWPLGWSRTGFCQAGGLAKTGK